MKIKSIKRNVAKEHTWDISTDSERYCLSNGCVSHNTSAQISNSTNGIEPPRALVSYKQSKDGVVAQVVPGIHHLKNKYDLLWDQKTPEGYLQVAAVLQKYIDQGISVNTSYNPEHFVDGKVPMSQLLKDMVSFYKNGGKQLYYCNTHDGAGEVEEQPELPAGDYVEEDCESCKL